MSLLANIIYACGMLLFFLGCFFVLVVAAPLLLLLRAKENPPTGATGGREEAVESKEVRRCTCGRTLDKFGMCSDL